MADVNEHAQLHVQELLATASANFERLYGEMTGEDLEFLRQRAVSQELEEECEALATCPVCGSRGVARGTSNVDWDYEHLVPNSHVPSGTMWFEADSFACGICGLRFESPSELKAGGMADRWTVDFDPLKYVPEIDEEVAYVAWRNKLQGRTG